MNQNEAMTKRIRNAYRICLAVVVILIGLAAWQWNRIGIVSMRPDYIRDVSLDMVSMILCELFIFSLAIEKNRNIQNRALFRLIFILCILFFLDFVSSFCEGHAGFAQVVFLANSLDYFFDTILIYCFYVYVREEFELTPGLMQYMNWFCRGILVITFILLVCNWQWGFYFTVDANAEYIVGDYDAVAIVLDLLVYGCAWYEIWVRKERSVREKIVMMTFLVFPLVASLWGLLFDAYEMLLPSYLFSIVLIYTRVFSMRSKRILEQQAVMDKQSMALMISQIQPHFLYNVLTTISNLCMKDPEEAEETTVLFSQYLRTNLDSLRKTEPIPFAEELGHIRTYVELEKKRFGEKLQYEIDCPETGFLVPALGLQPIVENSVKHGIRGKQTPGLLQIRSRKVENGYEVLIEDDGVGFDQNAPLPQDGKSHVGMKNVQSRLSQMCQATMQIESSPGNGCKTTIFFPNTAK